MQLGICLNKLDDFENAISSFEKAVELEKDYLIYLNFTIICIKKEGGNLPLAKKNFELFKKLFAKTRDIDKSEIEQINKQQKIIEDILKIL